MGDARAEASAVSNIALIEETRGNFEVALQGQRRALDLLIGVEDRTKVGGIHTNIGNVLCRLGRFDEAIDNHLRALAAAQETGNVAFEAEFHNDFANTLRIAGQADRAATEYHRALALAEELDLRHEQARSHHGLGMVLRAIDPEAARGHWQRALARYDEQHRVDIDAIHAELVALESQASG
jgi:tetratricopeptide (TPR) repeat protein